MPVPCREIVDHVIGYTVDFGGDGEVCELFSTPFSFDHAAGEPLATLLPDVVHIAMADRDAAQMLAVLEGIGREEAQGAFVA